MTWQIAEVKRPLASIGKICDAGNIAVFTDKGGYIVSQDSARGMVRLLESTDKPVLKMNREQGVYGFDVWVPRRGGQGNSIPTHNRYSHLEEEDERDAPNMDFVRLGTDLF